MTFDLEDASHFTNLVGVIKWVRLPEGCRLYTRPDRPTRGSEHVRHLLIRLKRICLVSIQVYDRVGYRLVLLTNVSLVHFSPFVHGLRLTSDGF